MLEEATEEDRKKRQNHSQKRQWWKRRCRKRQRQIAEKEHRGEELERRRAEYLREAHSAEQSDKDVSRGKRAQPTAGNRAQQTAGEKSVHNSRGEWKEQKEQCQLQAETYEENNASKKKVGPMTRDKDIACHQHIVTEQEWKVAEEARENQVEIEEEIEVEE